MRKLREKLSYQYDQFLSRGTFSLLVLLFVFILIIIISIGVVSLFTSQESNLFKLFWIVFLHILDPGTITATQGKIAYIILMTIATFAGIIITTIFISIIVTALERKLDALKKGRSKVVEKNHTLILGWDESIYVIITQLIKANSNARKPVIVILSSLDVTTMHNRVKEAGIVTRHCKLIFRYGSIHSIGDLQMCNINGAQSTIIVGDDLITIKALLVISKTDYFNQNRYISTVIDEQENLDVAQSINREQIDIIYTKEAITRIIAQTSLQPGLASIYRLLFDFSNDDIYFYNKPLPQGQTFKSLQMCFENSIVMGFLRDGQIKLNPSSDTPILENDKLILISADAGKSSFSQTQCPISTKHIIKTAHARGSHVDALSLIGFNEKTIPVLQELDSYLHENSRIKLLVSTEKTKNDILKTAPKGKNFTLEIFVAQTHLRKSLDMMIEQQTDGIIIFATDTDTGDPDTRSIVSLLHIKEIERQRNQKYSIVTEIKDPKNAQLVDLIKVDDFVISDLVSNKMLTQISKNHWLNNIFNTLLIKNGSEIYIKPAHYYIKPDEQINFYTLIESCTNKNEVALGYVKHAKDSTYDIRLNPNKKEPFSLSKNDSVIVLSKDQWIQEK